MMSHKAMKVWMDQTRKKGPFKKVFQSQNLQGVQVRQILESRSTHEGQRVVIEMSGRAAEFKPKSFTMREWHHLLDIHLLEPKTVSSHCMCAYQQAHCALCMVAFVQMWIISVLRLFLSQWVWPYMVRSRGLLWKAPSGMEAISLLWNPLQEEYQGDSVKTVCSMWSHYMRKHKK